MSDAHDGLRHPADAWAVAPDACATGYDPYHAGADDGACEATRFGRPAIAACLARLGPVLWLERHPPDVESPRRIIDAHGLFLFGHPALAILGCCDSVTAHFAVTAHGPREWLDFRDANAAVQAKLFLLPDTDYFAWDRMLEGCAQPPPRQPQPWHAHAAFLRSALARLGRSWRAHLFTFRFDRTPFMSVLDAGEPPRISPLGLELARVIADTEHAELCQR